MARTYKDKREMKTKRKRFFQPIWTKRFERRHYKGAEIENDELDFCPKCQAPTDFQSGFLNCAKCDWGNYAPANGQEEDGGFDEYKSAA